MNNTLPDKSLTSSQREAVKSVSGPVLCIAGPGSGKTYTIVQRLIYMIGRRGIEPSSILVVTFTRAAADSMRRRFLSMYGSEDSQVSFGTFHSVFFRILRQHYGYGRQNILNRDTAYKIILSMLDGKNELLASNPELIGQIIDEIGYVKSTGRTVGEYSPSTVGKELFIRLFSGYSSMLKEMNLLDFEDMLNKTYDLLSENPAVLKLWQSKFKYILVDEFQDINSIQYKITKMLAYPENNLFAVGDDDQSIYAFRGAAPEIMKQLPDDYPDAKIIKLETNFRCSAQILNASLNVISNNRTRYEKKLTAANEAGCNVILKCFESSFKEHGFLSRLIAKELDEGRKAENIAVLCRTNSQCLAIASRLAEANVPFNVKGGISTVYDNRYVQPIIAYLRFLSGDCSRSVFLQFCNKPIRYITRESLSDNEISMEKLLDYFEKEKKLYVLKNIRQLDYDLKLMKNMNTSAAVHYIRKVAGYEDYLKNSLNLADGYFEEVLDWLDELEQESAGYPAFTAYLTHIDEYKRKISELKEKNPVSAVSLATYHGCKGLEYEFVCMPDCMEGVTPYKKSVSPQEIEEERRMFYVAMTRAKEKLYLSYSLKRHGKQCRCSRFAEEIKNGVPIKKGCRIMHEAYKEGTVIDVSGDCITVKFDRFPVSKKLSRKACDEKGLIHVIS